MSTRNAALNDMFPNRIRIIKPWVPKAVRLVFSLLSYTFSQA